MLGGWSFEEILRYVAGLARRAQAVFHNRGIELSTEIFEGRVTKYLVMPLRYFALLQGRFLQYTLLQVVIAGLVWAAGSRWSPDRWLVPVSAGGVAGAAARPDG